MFSKKVIYLLMAIFAFLSISALLVNMPEKKDPAVMKAIEPHFPYEITKTMGGLDLLDKRTGERLKLENAKVYVAYDHYLKKWGKNHLKLQGNELIVLDDEGNAVKTLSLNDRQLSFVRNFFFQPAKQ